MAKNQRAGFQLLQVGAANANRTGIVIAFNMKEPEKRSNAYGSEYNPAELLKKNKR